MELLKSEYKNMVDLFLSAKKQLIVSLPNISSEIAEALITTKEINNIQPFIFLEFNENTFRAGFGDIKGIISLKEKGIPFYDKQGINIYFIITDESGYFFFPKSRFMEKEGSSYDLFPMEPNQVKTLKLMFNLLDDEDPSFDLLVDYFGIDTLEKVSKGISVIEKEQSEKLEQKLISDPPLEPNFGRILEVYKAKFQIIELKFKGANLHVKKVKLPKNALPFRDDQLKRSVEASLRLFTDIPEKKFLDPFFLIKTDLEILRNSFMYYLKSRDKNLIRRTDKGEIENDIKKIRERIEGIKENLLNKLQEEINNTRTRIKKNLIDFLIDNTPKEFEGLNGIVLENEIRNMATNITSRIRYPKSKDLLEEMKIDLHYYDITWSDLNDDDLRKEMVKTGLLTPEESAFISEQAISAKKSKMKPII